MTESRLRGAQPGLPDGWVTRIGTAETMADLQRVADGLAADLGFGRVTYSLHETAGGGDTSRLPAAFFTGYPDEWIARYVTQDYGRIDPVVQAALRGGAFRWSVLPVHTLRAEQLHVLMEAREFGIDNGFSVAAVSVGVLGIMTALPEGGHRDRHDALRYGTEALSTLGLVIHERARLLARREARDVLDDLAPHEMQALALLVDGQHPDDAADVMGVGSVVFARILRRVMARLGVLSLDHLRARAAILGLVRPPSLRESLP